MYKDEAVRPQRRMCAESECGDQGYREKGASTQYVTQRLHNRFMTYKWLTRCLSP
jgi:hypothetical protein